MQRQSPFPLEERQRQAPRFPRPPATSLRHLPNLPHPSPPQGMVKHYVFVSSAGAYKADSIEPMHVEGDARKASAGHVAVEDYLKQVGGLGARVGRAE